MNSMEEPSTYSLANKFELDRFVKVVSGRKIIAVVIFASLFVIATVVTFLIPSIYRSSATVLIEQQEIPQELVRSTVTSFADQRIQMIIQKVMAFSRLSEIIKKYDLYSQERKQKPLEYIVENMRNDIEHGMVSAEVVDPKSGKPVEATIAFKIAYLNKNPIIAQKVTNEIVSLILEENLKNRTEQTEQAEAFLSEELNRLRDQTNVLEQKLAIFKEENLKILPEQKDINIGMLERVERELDAVITKTKNEEERLLYLNSQLKQVDTNIRPDSRMGDFVMSPEQRAKYLQDRYLTLLAMYAPSHPDVKRTKRELDEFVRDERLKFGKRFLERQILIMEDERKTLLNAYSSNHPDVLRLQDGIVKLRNIAKGAIEEPISKIDDNADNPTYVQLATDVEAARVDLNHLRATKNRLENKIEELETNLLSMPKIEKKYRELLRDYDNTSKMYRDVKAKQLEAQMAKALERERKGERFTLIEPPLVPEQPYKPNRAVIFSIGVLFSIMLAFGSVWLLEQLSPKIRTAGDVARVTGMPPLAIIPYVNTHEDVARNKKLWIYLSIGVFFILFLVMSVVHLLLIPIDVLFYALLNKYSD